MIAPSSRRGFLRGLTALPLIGGGVTLIGSPTAVAEPVTADLLTRYRDWLGIEYGEALIETSGLGGPPERVEMHRRYRREWCAESRALSRSPDAFAVPPAFPPSTRAALVLSAVGCDWRRA